MVTQATPQPTSAQCTACLRISAKELYSVKGFTVVQCECGLARTVLPAGFDPASIYTTDYFDGGSPDGYPNYGGNAEELRIEFARTAAALRAHTPRGRLVEYGCAFGYFLEEASTTFSCLGIELSDYARSICAARGFDVEREATPALLAEKGPFDAAVMLDVLEHMTDPGEVLGELHAAMRPGGHLLLTTGDYGSLVARLMGRRWRLMTPPQHLWFFTRATVTALLERTGFRVIDFTHPWKHVPFALIGYQAARYLGGQDIVRRFVPRGGIPLNLFDAMRVIATRI